MHNLFLQASDHPHPHPRPLLSRNLWVTEGCIVCAIQITQLLPRSYFESLSTSGPSPSDGGYAKVSSRERGLDHPSAARNKGYAKVLGEGIECKASLES